MRYIFKKAQSARLNAQSVYDLLAQATEEDPNTQQYLFEGPGVDEIRRVRNVGAQKETLQQILSTFHAMFSAISETLQDDPEEHEIDDDELEQEIDYYVETYTQDFTFLGKDDEMWDFLTFVDPSNIEWEKIVKRGLKNAYTRLHPNPDNPQEINQPLGEPQPLTPEQKEQVAQEYASIITDPNGVINPGAQSVVEQLFSLEQFKVLYIMKNKKTKGSKIWLIYKDECGENLECFVKRIQGITPLEEASDIESFTQEFKPLIDPWDYDGEKLNRIAWALQSDDEDTFLEVVREVTNEIMVDEADSGRSVPAFVSTRQLQETLTNDFESELSDWYKDRNEHNLRQSAEESLSERHSENFSEDKRTLHHSTGYNLEEMIGLEVETERRGFTSSRTEKFSELFPTLEDWMESLSENEDTLFNTIPLPEILQIGEVLGDIYTIKGSRDTAHIIHAYGFAIWHLSSQQQDMKFMFNNDIENSKLNDDYIKSFLDDTELENLPQFFPTSMREELEERGRELERYLAEKRRIDEQRHRMLSPGAYMADPEYMRMLKEKGISERPFPHAYSLDRSQYPGAGFSRMENLTPFQITITPQKLDGYDLPDFPEEMMDAMQLHQLPNRGGKALGWVGGFADYENKILYIQEVQSDIMQRTPHMRDPDKAKKQREADKAKIQEEIARLNQSNNPVSKVQQEQEIKQQITDLEQKDPVKFKGEIAKLQQRLKQLSKAPAGGARERIMATIQRIEQENAGLQINSPRYQQNQNTLINLQLQLQKIPQDNANDTNQARSQARIQELEQQLAALNQIKDRDFAQERGYYKDFSKWHDYRSKLENTFKDWVPIFFNIAMREAKSRGYQKVRIIDSNSLMEIWKRFAKPSTRDLFKRVYDDTAAVYQPTSVETDGKTWHEVDLNNPNLKLANREIRMNWLQKLYKQATTEWLVQMPGSNKQVWQIHLDKFFEVMKRKMPELGAPEFDTGQTEFQANEGNNEVFRFWLEEVPAELKMGNDLEPSFKKAVQDYVMSQYNFNPFENDEETEYTPSDDELDSWFNSEPYQSRE